MNEFLETMPDFFRLGARSIGPNGLLDLGQPSYRTTARELWEKYAPEAWQPEPPFWVRDQHQKYPGPGPFSRAFTVETIGPHMLKWILTHVPTIETAIALVTEGHSRYLVACHETSYERRHGKTHWDVKLGFVRADRGYCTDQQTKHEEARNGEAFFAHKYHAWMRASVPDYFDGKERFFELKHHLSWLDWDTRWTWKDPYEPLRELRDAYDLHTVITKRRLVPFDVSAWIAVPLEEA